MTSQKATRETFAKMSFAAVYPHYVTKVEKKERSVAELNEVISWLTGFDDAKISALLEQEATFETVFVQAELNPNAHLIKGVICGYRVEEIEDDLTQKVRYMDKLVDELAKGKKMEMILRSD